METCRRKMQSGQRATRYECCNKTGEAKRVIHARQNLLRLLLAIQHPAEIDDHDREQIGRAPEEVKQQIGSKRANVAHAVVDLRAAGSLTEARIGHVVGEQRVPKYDRDYAEHDQRTLSQRARDLRR